MNKELTLWKEFKEDQLKRRRAFLDDPERIALFENLNYLNYPIVRIYEIAIEAKYEISKGGYEDFLNWLADGKPTFRGIKIKNEIIKDPPHLKSGGE